MLSTLSMLRDTGTARARHLLLHFPIQIHDKLVWVGQQHNVKITPYALWTSTLQQQKSGRGSAIWS